jgi:hypothetical protein
MGTASPRSVRAPQPPSPHPVVSPRPGRLGLRCRFKLSAKGKPSVVEDVFRSDPETPEELEDLLRESNELVVEAATLAEALRKTGRWAGAQIQD